MKIPQILALLGCLLLGLLGGYFIGRHSNSAVASVQEVEQATKIADGATYRLSNTLNKETDRSGMTGVGGSRTQLKVDVSMIDDEVLRRRFQDTLNETDWVQKESAFLAILADADLQEVQRMYKALGSLYKEGWATNELHSRVKMREGMLLGEEGMDQMPAEPNGLPIYPMRERMRGWASGSPAESWEWLQSMEPGRAREMMISEWQKGLSDADPRSLQALLPDLPAEYHGALLGRIISGSVHEGGLESLSTWYQEFGNSLSDESKKVAVKHAVNRFGQSPQKWDDAVDFLVKVAAPSDKVFADGLQQLVWRGARWDPKKSLDILNEYLPQNEHLAQNRARYINDTIKWASSSSVVVIGDWLDKNRNSPIYDDVASRYVQQVSSLDQEAARVWADSIQNARLREEVIAGLGR